MVFRIVAKRLPLTELGFDDDFGYELPIRQVQVVTGALHDLVTVSSKANSPHIRP